MDAEDVKKKLELGGCLLVAQEGKGKSELWKTFDLVAETTGDQEKGGYKSKHCESIMCAKQLLLDYNIIIMSDHLEQCKQY